MYIPLLSGCFSGLHIRFLVCLFPFSLTCLRFCISLFHLFCVYFHNAVCYLWYIRLNGPFFFLYLSNYLSLFLYLSYIHPSTCPFFHQPTCLCSGAPALIYTSTCHVIHLHICLLLSLLGIILICISTFSLHCVALLAWGAASPPDKWRVKRTLYIIASCEFSR